MQHLPNPAATRRPVLLCLSHLRWDWVYQRPQHLMTRAAANYRVAFLEEPLPAPEGTDAPGLRMRTTPEGVLVVTPLLPPGLGPVQADAAQRSLLDELLTRLDGPAASPAAPSPAVVWYYTPMALEFAGHLNPAVTVFDSMDELSAFSGASPRLLLLERRLLRQSDLVFTGGRSLHEAKRGRHPHVHMFPSSVDAAHFGLARGRDASPPDQACLPGPRIGYFGVIDERMDLALLDGVARRRPDWQFVMVGPVTKIEPGALPRHPNLHWLGMRPYADLPAYLSGWDAGLMPFALNEATQYISPTKTPEYLAAGVPVVSTPVADVVHGWGRDGLVGIASTPDAVVSALETGLAQPRGTWLARVDRRLVRTSWDTSWAAMQALIHGAGEAAATRKPTRTGQALSPMEGAHV